MCSNVGGHLTTEFYDEIWALWLIAIMCQIMSPVACSQATVDGITAAFYNAFFTSLPIGILAMVDRPVRHLATLLAHPQTYNTKPPLTSRAFWKTGVLTAIVHAAVRGPQLRGHLASR